MCCNLVQDTTVNALERCSGHDGTYAVKKETRDRSVKIARPVVRKVDEQEPDHFMSDCPMAATHIANLSAENRHGVTSHDAAAHGLWPVTSSLQHRRQ